VCKTLADVGIKISFSKKIVSCQKRLSYIDLGKTQPILVRCQGSNFLILFLLKYKKLVPN
jgi:hypothetical protein